MNLFLRPLSDPNGVTWSIIWSLVILLIGAAYYIYTIMKLAYSELEEDVRPNQQEGCGSGSDPTLLTHRIEDAENETKELKERVRNLEKKVWGASAVIAALITIAGIADALNAQEMNYGSNDTTHRKSCYNFRVVEINRVVDGDTIDVTIDLGFDLYKKERVRIAGVDTPEKRTRNLEEKSLWNRRNKLRSKKNWKGRWAVMMILLSVLNLLAVSGSMGVFLVGYLCWGRRYVPQRTNDCGRICMVI